MFTGIVEGVGKVVSLTEEKESWCLALDLPFEDISGLEAGASLAVNGCCLTFREQGTEIGRFDLLDETLKRTNLGKLKEGDLVNLERSIPANGRMGGHFVTGHIDGVGELQIFEERGKNLYFRVSLPPAYSRYLVDKGCVAVDGCSLTVCEVEQDSFAIWLIPHTLGKTNLNDRQPGDYINLEFDILAKYVEKFSFPILENPQI
jgi:riboflavin synthase